MKTRRLALVLLCLAATVWICGCLSTRYGALLSYDEKNDEFHILNVYQQISTVDKSDSEYLYQLWRNRDHLIRLPNIDILAMPAILRMGAHKCAWINLGKAPEKLDVIETKIAVDQIRVMPGTFFLRGADSLCYYDHVVVPGKVVDQTLVAWVEIAGAALNEQVDKESKRRADGGKPIEWADVFAKVDHEISGEKNPADDKLSNQWPIEVLDADSLKIIKAGIEKGSLKISRQKQVFSFRIPLSTSDAKQFTKLYDFTYDKLKAHSNEEKQDQLATIALKFKPAFKVTPGNESLEFQLDLGVIIKQTPELAGLNKPLEEAKPEQLTRMKETIAGLRSRNVPIDESLTVQEIAKQFFDGTLKSYPSETPVEPGSEMVQAPVKK